MKYSVAVHKETDSCYGVTVPDIEGCFSAGDTLDEALANAHQAINAHLEYLAEEGVLPPVAEAVDVYLSNDDYQGAIWCYVDVDTSAFLGKTEKATVTLPALLISKIDGLVNDGTVKSRSAFLAESATKQLSGF
jgi:predicted RNase H-like HicB family nuclease